MNDPTNWNTVDFGTLTFINAEEAKKAERLFNELREALAKVHAQEPVVWSTHGGKDAVYISTEHRFAGSLPLQQAFTVPLYAHPFAYGPGCSECGKYPAVNVEGEQWLCGPCVNCKLPDAGEYIAEG